MTGDPETFDPVSGALSPASIVGAGPAAAHGQAAYDVRLDWGPTGGAAVAGGADVAAAADLDADGVVPLLTDDGFVAG